MRTTRATVICICQSDFTFKSHLALYESPSPLWYFLNQSIFRKNFPHYLSEPKSTLEESIYHFFLFNHSPIVHSKSTSADFSSVYTSASITDLCIEAAIKKGSISLIYMWPLGRSDIEKPCQFHSLPNSNESAPF